MKNSMAILAVKKRIKKKEKLILSKLEEYKDAEDFEDYEEIDPHEIEKEINYLKDYDETIPSPEIISRLIKINKQKEKKEEILNDLSKLDSSKFEDLEYPNDEELDDYYSKFQMLKIKQKECIHFLKENEYIQITSDIEEDKKLLEEVNKKIDEIEQMLKIIEEYKIIDYKQNEIKNLEHKIKEIIVKSETNKKLEKIIKETESEVMNNNIETINIELNNILSALFEDIKIELSMIKNLKNGGAKPFVNLNIIINGKEYTNIDYLSGGELDRISIALTITFNLIMGSKFMLLDEIMSSLDGENREKCLKIMRRYLKNKIILNVCHETTEGYYDQIIKFD